MVPRTSKDPVVEFYFTKIGVDEYQCKCGCKRKRKPNSGFTNLMSHIVKQHPNWRAEILTDTSLTDRVCSMVFFIKISIVLCLIF